jgi:cell division septation protein DedD
MASKKSRSKKRGKKYQIELTSLSTFLWGIFLFFLFAWVFVLGISVGSGSLPKVVTNLSSYIRGVIGKPAATILRPSRSYDAETPKKSKPDPRLAFYEKLAIKKEEVKKKRQPGEEGDNQKTDSPPRKAKVSQTVLPDRKEGKRAGTSNTQPDQLSESKRYTVQLASLADGDKAKKMSKQLLNQGYPAYFYEVKVKGKTYYRVRCGKFTSKEDARNYAEKLARNEGIKGFIARTE